MGLNNLTITEVTTKNKLRIIRDHLMENPPPLGGGKGGINLTMGVKQITSAIMPEYNLLPRIW